MPRHRSHTINMSVAIGHDTLEIKADLDFTIISRGSHATYDDPGDAPEIEVNSATLLTGDGAIAIDAPPWLFDFISSSDAVFQELCEGIEDDGPDPDAQLEAMRDRCGND